MTHRAIRNRPIRQPEKRGFQEALRILVFFAGLAAPFLLYVHLSSKQLEGEYTLTRLVAQRQKLLMQHERLLLRRAAFLRPEQVRVVAKEKLGLVDEDPREWTLRSPGPVASGSRSPASRPTGGNGLESPSPGNGSAGTGWRRAP